MFVTAVCVLFLPFNLQFETIYQLTADRIRASTCKYFSLVAIFCTKVFNCSISLNSCAFVRFSHIKMPRDSSRPRKRKFRGNQFSQPKEKSPKSELKEDDEQIDRTISASSKKLRPKKPKAKNKETKSEVKA